MVTATNYIINITDYISNINDMIILTIIIIFCEFIFNLI